MVCEICQKHNATVHLKQVVDGNVRELYVCESCAKENGFEVSPGLGLTDFLFGPAAKKDATPAPREDLSCPVCHMRRSDFRKTSRLGCAACYQTFAAELVPMIEDMHKGDRHVGKIPARDAREVQAAGLREELERAVAAQNFEEAARIRDRIRALKPESASAGAPPATGEVRS